MVHHILDTYIGYLTQSVTLVNLLTQNITFIKKKHKFYLGIINVTFFTLEKSINIKISFFSTLHDLFQITLTSKNFLALSKLLKMVLCFLVNTKVVMLLLQNPTLFVYLTYYLLTLPLFPWTDGKYIELVTILRI